MRSDVSEFVEVLTFLFLSLNWDPDEQHVQKAMRGLNEPVTVSCAQSFKIWGSLLRDALFPLHSDPFLFETDFTSLTTIIGTCTYNYCSPLHTVVQIHRLILF